MTPMEYLRQAERIAYRHGDIYWFCEQYTQLREYHDVRLSAEEALAQQGLLELMPDD